MAEVETHTNMMGMHFDATDFQKVVETAFADAFTDHGLTPTGVTLHDGLMTVTVRADI